MPIGQIIGGVAAGAGALFGGGSQNRNLAAASQISQRVNDQNNALAGTLKDASLRRTDGYSNRGDAAGNQINALLGIGGGGANWSAYLQANPDVAQGYYQTADTGQFGSPEQYAQWHYKTYGQNEGRQLPMSDGAAAAGQAMDVFRNSTGFQRRMQSALDATAGNFSGAGAFQSGAAAKALQDRAKEVDLNDTAFYLNALGNQQGVGLSSAIGSAEILQNYGSQVMGNNNLNAQNQIMARLGKQNPFANALGTIGGGLLSYGLGGTRR